MRNFGPNGFTSRPLVAAIVLALGVGGAHAATITVRDDGDAGGSESCTLRQAIVSANLDNASASVCMAGAGADTIDFAAGLTGATITLAHGQLEVVGTLGIYGSDQIIDADGSSRVLNVASAATLSASKLTLTGGDQAKGGGIYVAGSDPYLGLDGGSVKLSDVTISGNNAAFGGGIYIAGTGGSGPSGPAGGRANLVDTIISGNRASYSGGGIYVAGAASLATTTVSGNTADGGYGGGIAAAYATVAAVDTLITGNVGVDGGNDGFAAGGIYSYLSSLKLTGTTISDNRAIGSASASLGHATGGIYLRNSNATLLNCTLTGNSATGIAWVAGGLSVSQRGGSKLTAGSSPAAATGIYSTVVTNTTVVGNTATSAAGGIYGNAHAAYSVVDATDIVGGVLVNPYHDAGGTLNLGNAIVAGNSGKTHADIDVAGTSGSATASHSLLGTSLTSSFTGNGNVFADDPGIGSLADNGGATVTRALQAGSPAIDAGDNNLVPPGVTTDQRGVGYPRIVNGIVDIGAFELRAAAPPPTPANAAPVPVRSPWMLGLLGLLLACLGAGRSLRKPH